MLLVDCDLRKSRIRRYLQLERKDGLSNVLTTLDKEIKKNVRENLECLLA